MTDTQTVPGWVEPGAPAVLYRNMGTHAVAHLIDVTIVRVTPKGSIVLSNDWKGRVRPGGKIIFERGFKYHLLHPDDHNVKVERLESEADALRMSIRSNIEALDKSLRGYEPQAGFDRDVIAKAIARDVHRFTQMQNSITMAREIIKEEGSAV